MCTNCKKSLTGENMCECDGACFCDQENCEDPKGKHCKECHASKNSS